MAALDSAVYVYCRDDLTLAICRDVLRIHLRASAGWVVVTIPRRRIVSLSVVRHRFLIIALTETWTMGLQLDDAAEEAVAVFNQVA